MVSSESGYLVGYCRRDLAATGAGQRQSRQLAHDRNRMRRNRRHYGLTVVWALRIKGTIRMCPYSIRVFDIFTPCAINNIDQACQSYNRVDTDHATARRRPCPNHNQNGGRAAHSPSPPYSGRLPYPNRLAPTALSRPAG